MAAEVSAPSEITLFSPSADKVFVKDVAGFQPEGHIAGLSVLRVLGKA